MTTEEFNHLVHDRTEKIIAILASKAAEYAREDRLSNFKRAAAMMQVTPERALLGMLSKHIVSLLDMVDDLDHDRMNAPETWHEKLGDAINYFILLEGLIIERFNRDRVMRSALVDAADRIHSKSTKRHRR